jgi:hypothetical protein
MYRWVTGRSVRCDAGNVTGLDDVIGDIAEQLDAEREAELRKRLRDRLMALPKEWLVDQLLEQVGDPAGDPAPAGEPHDSDSPDESRIQAERCARAARIRAMCLDDACLHAFIERCRPLTRERLERDGFLIDPPVKGAALIGASCRTPGAEALLGEAKDLLEALLFGDAELNVRLVRVQRELLTITVARPKVGAIACLLRAATEIDAEGTWRDPEQISHDDRAPNTQIEVEYGEVATEAVGRGIKLALRLINDLEINEQILYARMENVEESTLEGTI